MNLKNPMSDSLQDETLNMTTKCLKPEVVLEMAKCLTPEVIRYVESHQEYAEMMFKLYDKFLVEKIGDLNEELKGELTCLFMDSMVLRPVPV